jgi:hypothetical protein
MYQSIIILDDFYADAMDIRKMALTLDYPDHGGKAYYSGRNSKQALINQGIVEGLSRVVGEPLSPSPRSAVGHFRITFAHELPRQDIHIDPYRDWAGVVYLNLPDQCIGRGGTSFWRHKRLGIEAMPRNQQEIERYGYKSYDEMRVALAEGDGLDRGKWDLTMTVPMRFNRCILFRSWLWHSHCENFGDTMETGRLIQVFFFDIVRGPVKPKLPFEMPPAPKPTVAPHLPTVGVPPRRG